jgi:hypothetical protein
MRDRVACNCQAMLERQGGVLADHREWPGCEVLGVWCRMARMQLRSCDLALGKVVFEWGMTLLRLVVLRLGGVGGGDWRGGDEAGENSVEGFHDMRSRVWKHACEN